MTLILRNERDTDNSGLRNRVPAIPDDDEEETTLASQIRPKYQLADINEDEDISEDQEEQVIGNNTCCLISQQFVYIFTGTGGIGGYNMAILIVNYET